MVTVGWLARQSQLGLSLIAGAEHTGRTILWAHAIELADPTPYLSGGELVMTTGLKVGKTKKAQFDYVARLASADAAALAFDTGTSFRHVPEGILAAGDALGLPVFGVPPSTPFIAITMPTPPSTTAAAPATSHILFLLPPSGTSAIWASRPSTKSSPGST